MYLPFLKDFALENITQTAAIKEFWFEK